MKRIITALVVALALSCSAHAQTTYTAGSVNSADPCQTDVGTKGSAIVNIGATTTTQIVAAVSGQKVYVCGFVATLAGTTPTVIFKYGTKASTDCDTGATAMSGTFAPTTGSIVFAGWGGTVLGPTPVSQQLCATTAGTNSSFQGILTYVQQAN